MISSSKRRIIILITIGIFFALLSLIFINHSYLMGNAILDSNSYKNRNLDYENLKISKISGKIHIDNNWTAAKSAGICTGDGTYSDPYVIEDLIIDGGSVGSCILIENSDVYFRIENCTTYNSWGYYGAGIHLSYVSNSQLINNNCSSNSNGIYAYRSENNTILGNNAKKNSNGGIFLRFSDRNEVSGNTVNYNKNGIYILVSDYNIILGNTGNYNEEGLGLYSSNSNTISGNTVNNNEYGILIYESVHNTISGNTANNNLIGIYLDDNDVNTISGNIMNGCGLWIDGDLESMLSNEVDTTNLVNGKPLYYYTLETYLGENDFLNAGQVILVKCHNLLITNVNVSYSSTGIALHYCINNTISGNTVNNNSKGIYLTECDRNEVSGNIVTYNEEGIFLTSSDYNNISRNAVGNNSKGIELLCSTRNRIYQNIIVGNGIGIYSSCFCFGNCEKPSNEIFNNTFSDNDVDILIYPDPNGYGGDIPFLYLIMGLAVILAIAITFFGNYARNKLGKKKFKY